MNKFSNHSLQDGIGKKLHDKRRKLGYTLGYIANTIKVDAGQLSRFENSKSKYLTKNLQKYIAYLEDANNKKFADAIELGKRVTDIAKRSEQHRLAIQSLLESVEILGQIESKEHTDDNSA